jgi:hypothetical protein
VPLKGSQRHQPRARTSQTQRKRAKRNVPRPKDVPRPKGCWYVVLPAPVRWVWCWYVGFGGPNVLDLHAPPNPTKHASQASSGAASTKARKCASKQRCSQAMLPSKYGSSSELKGTGITRASLCSTHPLYPPSQRADGRADGRAHTTEKKSTNDGVHSAYGVCGADKQKHARTEEREIDHRTTTKQGGRVLVSKCHRGWQVPLRLASGRQVPQASAQRS